MPGVLDASVKVNRAFEAGAMAVGVQVEIVEVPGYMPRRNDENFNKIFEENLNILVGPEHVQHLGHMGGCSDFGDVQHLVPALHPFIGGMIGGGHASDFAVQDPEMAYVTAAKSMAMTAIDLLANGCEKLLELKKDFVPVYKNREEYLAAWAQLMGE